MKKPAFTRVSLSDVRVIMMIMLILVVELLCQAAMGWISVLKYLLSGTDGRLWPHPVVLGIKCCCFLRSWLWWCLPGTEEPPGAAIGSPGIC
jgi:hypothetical protein